MAAKEDNKTLVCDDLHSRMLTTLLEKSCITKTTYMNTISFYCDQSRIALTAECIPTVSV